MGAEVAGDLVASACGVSLADNGTVTAPHIGGRCIPVMSGTIELA